MSPQPKILTSDEHCQLNWLPREQATISKGKGKIVIQTRSLSGLAGWLNPKL